MKIMRERKLQVIQSKKSLKQQVVCLSNPICLNDEIRIYGECKRRDTAIAKSHINENKKEMIFLEQAVDSTV